MTLRPAPARWFELVTTKSHVAAALGALALTGAVELEARADAQRAILLPDLDDLLKAYRAVARTYAGHWPRQRPVNPGGDPRALLESDWRRVSAWRAEADPLIAQIERLSQERLDLDQLSGALAVAGDRFPDPSLLLAAGPRFAAALLSLPAETTLGQTSREALLAWWRTDASAYVLALAPPDEARAIANRASGLKGNAIPLPAWLPASPPAARRAVDERRDACAAEIETLETALAVLADKHALAEAIGDFVLFEWMREHAGNLAGGARLVFVTGWTTAIDDRDLQAELERRGAPCLVRLLAPPFGADPPLFLRNPRWVRPFELFARMLGMPGRHEADPSVVVAIVAPLLFGFMFGDVGQGLALSLAGLLWGDRAPVLRLLVPAGLVAAVFGLMFGSVFCLEPIPALWLRPLDQPVTLLAIALAAGAALMTFGLALKAMQAAWRGAAARWFAHEAGLSAAYLALLAGVVWRPALWAAIAGAVWFVVGAAALERRRPLAAAGIAAAEFVEKLMQLLVNTLSFSRVGAFALAHAGLSAAVIGVAQTAGGAGFVVVLVAGNALILALEGLVVGIQTTRLMLFEFFIRFLSGGGRALNPLTPPRDWRPVLPAALQPNEP